MTKLLSLLAMCLLLMGTLPTAAAPLTVGAIYVGSTNDYGYNRSMHDGLVVMKEAIPGTRLLEAENVPETAEAERVMESMIQQGAKLIFATSFGHQQSAFNLAKNHRRRRCRRRRRPPSSRHHREWLPSRRSDG